VTGFPAGTRVLVDGKLVDAVSALGTFSTPVEPGSRSISVEQDKCDPRPAIVRTFVRGKPQIIAASDFAPCVASKPDPPKPPPPPPSGPGIIDFRMGEGEPVVVTVTLDGGAPRRINTAGRLTLAPGKYRLTVSGRWTGDKNMDLALGAGETKPFDARADDLDWFARPWVKAATWWQHDGGGDGFNVYERPGLAGTYTFTVKLRGVRNAANPTWVIGDPDRGVYRKFELVDGRFYKTLITPGSPGRRDEAGRYPNGEIVFIRVEVSGDRIVHKACPADCKGTNWVDLDTWTAALPSPGGGAVRSRFAFAVTTGRRLEIANFDHIPPGGR
jgi:hypothetical protein